MKSARLVLVPLEAGLVSVEMLDMVQVQSPPGLMELETQTLTMKFHAENFRVSFQNQEA